MARENRTRAFCRAMLVITMAAIFLFSSQMGEKSRYISDLAARLLGLTKSEGGLGPGATPIVMGLSLRKFAHIGSFILMGLFSYGSISSDRPRVTRMSAAMLLSYAWACLDELHQLFVPGRAGMFSDTLVDLAGIVIGVIIALYVSVWDGKREEKTDPIVK